MLLSHILSLAALLSARAHHFALSAPAPCPAPAPDQNQDQKTPIYSIAHRVVTVSGLHAALAHGANALEIDLCAYKSSDAWWADHDCISSTGITRGDSARDMFRAIAAQRNQHGANITFVWLDVKNPDHCADPKKCAIEGLRDLAREVLQPVGIRVLYGFYKTEKTRAFGVIRDGLNANEATALSGTSTAVMESYTTSGVAVSPRQRVMDYGYFNLPFEFGTCSERKYYTCTELRQAALLRDQGRLGKVFGWTSAAGQAKLVDQLLGTAKVDGLIHGFKNTDYYDHKDTRAAARDVREWVRVNGRMYRMAGNGDPPW